MPRKGFIWKILKLFLNFSHHFNRCLHEQTFSNRIFTMHLGKVCNWTHNIVLEIKCVLNAMDIYNCINVFSWIRIPDNTGEKLSTVFCFVLKESCAINDIFTFLPCYENIIYLCTHKHTYIHTEGSGGIVDGWWEGGKCALKPIILNVCLDQRKVKLLNKIQVNDLKLASIDSHCFVIM